MEINYINEQIYSMSMTKQFQEVEKYYTGKIILIQCGKNYLSYDRSADILKKINVGEHTNGRKNSSKICKIHYLSALESVTKMLSHGKSVVVIKQLKDGKKIVRQIYGIVEAIEDIAKCDLANIYIKKEEGSRPVPEKLIYNKMFNKESNSTINMENHMINYEFCKTLLKSYIVFVALNNKYISFENDAVFTSNLSNASLINSSVEFGKEEFEKNVIAILNCGKKIALISYSIIENEKNLFHRKIEFIDTIHDIPYILPIRSLGPSEKVLQIDNKEIVETLNDDTSDIISISNIEEPANDQQSYEKMDVSQLASCVAEIDLKTYFREHPASNDELIELVDCIDNEVLIKASVENWNIKLLELCINKIDIEIYNDIVHLTMEEVSYLSEKYDINKFVEKHPEFWNTLYIVKNYKNIDIIEHFRKYPITKENLLKISKYYNIVKLLKAFPNMIDLKMLEKYPTSFNTKDLIKSGYLFEISFLEKHDYELGTYLEQAKLVDEYIKYIISIDTTKKYKRYLVMNSSCTQDIKANYKDYFFDDIFISRQKEIEPVQSQEKYDKFIHNYESSNSFDKLVEVRNQEKAEEHKNIMRKLSRKNGWW